MALHTFPPRHNHKFLFHRQPFFLSKSPARKGLSFLAGPLLSVISTERICSERFFHVNQLLVTVKVATFTPQYMTEYSPVVAPDSTLIEKVLAEESYVTGATEEVEASDVPE